MPQPPGDSHEREHSLLAAMALLGPAGMHLWITSPRLADASALALISYVRLVFAATAGVVLFNEAIDGWLIAGATLIIGSAIYITKRGAAERVADRQTVIQNPDHPGH